MPQQYEELARELYVSLLRMKSSAEQVLFNEPWVVLQRSIKECEPILDRAGKHFAGTLTSEETTVYSRSNPKLPAGYALVSNRGRGDGYANNGFDADAICSDDGVQWFHVSRVGEPGCRTLVAERIK